MMKLTYLSGQIFFLNGELIKTVESAPDTLITLMSGEKMRVLENLEQVIQLWMDFKKRMGSQPFFNSHPQRDEKV